MTVRSVEGAAGCGKTTRLMGMLSEALEAHPLADGQRILALTFMHGARRRLVDRLSGVAAARGKVECGTVDGYAWRSLRRWRGLAAAIGIPQSPETAFDEVCNAAGQLLEQPEVRSWTARSFPIVVVDEGQDLSPHRLRMLKALAGATETLIAADEFQCLNEALRPNPLVEWLQEQPASEVLVQVHRTAVQGLLGAAAAIRAGQPPADGTQFRILSAPSHNLAAGIISNDIRWKGGSTIAIISPSPDVPWVRDAVERVGAGPIGKNQIGPYSIWWEGSDRHETAALCEHLNMEAESSAATTIAALHLLPRGGPIVGTIQWVETQVHAAGRANFTRVEVEGVIARQVTMRRQYGGAAGHKYLAMTVQQAKNREFDGVLVLWPFAVGGDAEQKRRLLYNAITRARRWCTVVVQGPNILQAAPFA